MILALIILLALVIEAAWEAKWGQNKGLLSNLVLVATMLAVEAMGLLAGYKYGMLFYVLYRFSAFDYIYSFFKYKHLRHTDRLAQYFNKYILLVVRLIVLVVVSLVLYHKGQ